MERGAETLCCERANARGWGQANKRGGASAPPPHRPSTASATRGRDGDAGPSAARMEVLTLRGDIGLLRAQLDRARTDAVAAEVRARAEREKLDELQKVWRRAPGVGERGRGRGRGRGVWCRGRRRGA
jgi:hypothetical protein